jgi:hypothetical protein
LAAFDASSQNVNFPIGATCRLSERKYPRHPITDRHEKRNGHLESIPEINKGTPEQPPPPLLAAGDSWNRPTKSLKKDHLKIGCCPLQTFPAAQSWTLFLLHICFDIFFMFIIYAAGLL